MKTIRKLTSIMFAVIIFCNISAFTHTHAQSITTPYDPTAAVNYASGHWNDGQGKCATFVSNCLKSGGCSSWSSSCGELLRKLQNEKYGTLQKLTVRNNYIYAADNLGIILPGDPIFFLCAADGCDNKKHVVIAGSVDSKGRICAYGHNNAQNNTPVYQEGTKCHNVPCDLYVFHMSGYSNDMYIKQAKNNTCTLASSVNLLRRTAYALGNKNYASITEASLAPTAWGSNGLHGSFTYNGITVTYGSPGENKKQFLADQLNNHPEGIIIARFTSEQHHAVLLTDYDSKTDTFYCVDSANAVPRGRIPLAESYLYGNTQQEKIRGISKIWYVKSTNDATESITPISISDGDYRIISALNDMSAVSISSDSLSKKANVILRADKETRNQTFNIKKTDDLYIITNIASGMVLDVESGSSQSGANVWQYSPNGTQAQQWIFEDAGNGYIYIRSALGNYLDVSGGKSSDGTNIQVYKGNRTASQKFKLVPAASEIRQPSVGNWTTTPLSPISGTNIETKLQHGYYHYTMKWSDNGYGAYPMNISDMKKCYPGSYIADEEYHEIWLDEKLTSTGKLTYYDKTTGTRRYFDAYTNIHCSDNISKMNCLYYLGTRTLYRYVSIP